MIDTLCRSSDLCIHGDAIKTPLQHPTSTSQLINCTCVYHTHILDEIRISTA